MTESWQGIVGTIEILTALIASYFWWRGGREENYLGLRPRIWRRFIAPIFWSVSLILFSILSGKFSWWFAMSPVLYIGQAHLGYGDKKNRTWFKILRRIFWSLTHCACGLVFAWGTGAWLIYGTQCAFSLMASVIFGAFNPFKSAPKEEGTIFFSSNFLLPLIF